MEGWEIGQFLDRTFAPSDVNDTVEWLSANGYALSSHRGESTFGAQFIYTGAAEVVIAVDRGQWMLDVAREPGAEAMQYDLLIAAQRDQPYGEVFPTTNDGLVGDRLPRQLPDGVSWRETLPGILRWIKGDDVEQAVRRAHRERNRLV